MKRPIEQYQGMDADAMSQMSRAAIFYAFRDMQDDIILLHEVLRQLWIAADIQMPNEPETKEAFRALTNKVKP